MSLLLQLVPILVILLLCGSTIAHPGGGASEAARYENYKRALPAQCRPEAVQETVQCDACRNAGISAVDPELYANWVNQHYNPLVSKYYNARMGLAFKRSCPATANLPITTPWLARSGGIALDEVSTDIIQRVCTFPTETDPFICVGTSGTSGTYGQSLGTLSYVAVATNSGVRGEGIWTAFCQCWDDSSVSWNVFSFRPTISTEHEQQINDTLAAIGFNPANFVRNSYPQLFPEP